MYLLHSYVGYHNYGDCASWPNVDHTHLNDLVHISLVTGVHVCLPVGANSYIMGYCTFIPSKALFLEI